MKKASVRDLHIRTSDLVRDAAGGAVIVIERRGEPVAELRPISPLTGAYVLLKPFRVLVTVKVPFDSADSLINLNSSVGSRLAMKSSGGFVSLVPLAE